MRARELLQRLRLEGFGLTVDGDRLIVTPASALTDDRRLQIRLHKPELLALLSEWRDEAQREVYPARTCADCQHHGRHRSCLEPVAAGLLTEAAGHGIVWPEPGRAATCSAFSARLAPMADETSKQGVTQ